LEIHLIPVKTAQGHEELSSRQRRLGQRHRTMLLLVDGQRTIESVLNMSLQAGVPETCLGELIGLGLVVVPQSGGQRWAPAVPPAAPPIAAAPVPVPAAAASASAQQPLEEDLDDDDDDEPEGLLSSSLPDTEFGMSTVVTDSVFDDEVDDDFSPNPLEDARDLLMHAVSTEAPVAGALTLMRLKRARTPMELLALIHEVETRINRPHRAMAVQQLMGRVAQLLSQAETLHTLSDAY
jgi:hypothetical protein